MDTEQEDRTLTIIMILSIIGLIGSETNACKGLLSSGSLKPAMLAITLECPAATTPTFLVLIKPFVVSIPSIESLFLFIPFTSQF